MRTRNLALLFVISSISVTLLAQTTAASGAPKAFGNKRFGTTIMMKGEMGRWWRDAEIAKKLQLNEGQISQLDQIFYDHRLKLIDYGAEMEKQDLKLQSMLDADQPDEGQIGSQVDLVLTARGKLEREYTFMNLDLRKVITLDQWRQLKSIRGERGPGDNIIYFQKKIEGPGAAIHIPFPPDFGPDSPPPPPEPNLY